MTTDNLTGIDELRRAMHDAANGVRERAEKVAQEGEARRRQRDTDDRDAELGRWLLRQYNDDALGVLDEEASQLARILVPRLPPAPAAAPVATPPVPPGPPAPATATPPADPPTQPLPAAQPNPLNPQGWSWLQWLLAALGLIVGLIVASVTNGFGNLHGAGHDVFVVFWFLALIVLGLFGGGFLGWRIDHQRNGE